MTENVKPMGIIAVQYKQAISQGTASDTAASQKRPG
jgi:hypothetical protein